MSRFDGRIAVITGGAKGIGESIVRKFYAEGAKIAIMDVNTVGAQQLAMELDPSGDKAIGLGCNIVNRSEVKAVFEAIVAKFGTVDILVNNAGITQDAIFHKMTEKQWDDVIAVNGKGLFNCTQEAWMIMKAQKYGKICNLSSTNASGEAGQANYAFTKAGIIAVTKSLAREGGRHNISVNCVRPGVIDTEMMRTVPENVLEDLVDKTAFKRLGKPSEVADVVAYLCSEEASWVTGEELLVAGGFMYR
ncbi:3-oxoacyl-[acyl-carrier protein] reductase [Desulfosporosinus sp. I2]|uniref:glucose 1-dehydrogenase n=1 Tax=Desulfosporosinus sp. I2 TaxID=1617025 RepID=UPI0005EF88A3|nr:glucose 1-dehydrogenase [Desulfosporosinus sp. I2]KJR48484.1 3-oxoacyl-[acyl-carrier protein] reductase [Desulfosporosinus sp. I2]